MKEALLALFMSCRKVPDVHEEPHLCSYSLVCFLYRWMHLARKYVTDELITVMVLFIADQRLDLNKLGPNDNDTVRGQIVGKNHPFSLACFLYLDLETKVKS